MARRGRELPVVPLTMARTIGRWLGAVVVLLAALPSWAQIPADYYLAARGKSGADLRAALHAIIRDHTRYPYTASSADTWDIIELADEDAANPARIVDVYLNHSYAKADHWSSFNTGGWNREHSWPKSYGFSQDGTCNYPYTDVHHLFASSESYNTARANLPFAFVATPEQQYPVEGTPFFNLCSGCALYQRGSWQTWEGRRGDEARAQLYLDVRYEGGKHSLTGCDEPDLVLTNDRTLIVPNSHSNFSPAYMGMLDDMLAWHLQDPPDARERRRDDVVRSFQGNRNPFVDHPEWVCAIWDCSFIPQLDSLPPRAPTNLSAVHRDDHVELRWDANTEADLAGYNVFRAGEPGGPYDLVNQALVLSNAFDDLTADPGPSYYYVVTAVDYLDLASVSSGEALAIGGSPLGPGRIRRILRQHR